MRCKVNPLWLFSTLTVQFLLIDSYGVGKACNLFNILNNNSYYI